MIARLVFQTLVFLVIIAALLFGPAGKLDWPAAWAFLALVGVASLVIGIRLAYVDPALLAERLRGLGQPQQAAWDTPLLILGAFLWCAWPIVMALDAVRWHISHVPPLLQGFGALAILVCFVLVWLTFRANSYAAPVVKLQTERGHKVATTGPYRYVRHPMYGSAILFFIGMPLMLGSWIGLLLAPLFVVLIGVRAIFEERMLTERLAGYAEYRARVRYRFVPLVW
jgi:protein-S-isoprenylcysteine O-methyltransferase Ste14